MSSVGKDGGGRYSGGVAVTCKFTVQGLPVVKTNLATYITQKATEIL